MNVTFKITFCVTVGVILAGLTGCEPKESVSERQERLYAAENMELKKEIVRLQEQFERDLQAKQNELDQCNKEINMLEKNFSKEASKMFEDSVIDSLMNQVQQLTKENTTLREEIETLNKKPEQQE